MCGIVTSDWWPVTTGSSGHQVWHFGSLLHFPLLSVGCGPWENVIIIGSSFLSCQCGTEHAVPIPSINVMHLETKQDCNMRQLPITVVFKCNDMHHNIMAINNYNIVLCCGMDSGLIFSLRSSNFFLPFTCLCLFIWSVVIQRSLPLWTWLFSSLGTLCLFLSGSLSCLLDLLVVLAPGPGPGPSVLVPWFLWPRPHALLPAW